MQIHFSHDVSKCPLHVNARSTQLHIGCTPMIKIMTSRYINTHPTGRQFHLSIQECRFYIWERPQSGCVKILYLNSSWQHADEHYQEAGLEDINEEFIFLRDFAHKPKWPFDIFASTHVNDVRCEIKVNNDNGLIIVSYGFIGQVLPNIISLRSKRWISESHGIAFLHL